MEISLTPELEQLVHRQVASGRYPSAGAVVGEALRLMEERDRLEELRRFVGVGIEQADRGELTDGAAAFEEVRDQIRRRLHPGP